MAEESVTLCGSNKVTACGIPKEVSIVQVIAFELLLFESRSHARANIT